MTFKFLAAMAVSAFATGAVAAPCISNTGGRAVAVDQHGQGLAATGMSGARTLGLGHLQRHASRSHRLVAEKRREGDTGGHVDHHGGNRG